MGQKSKILSKEMNDEVVALVPVKDVGALNEACAGGWMDWRDI